MRRLELGLGSWLGLRNQALFRSLSPALLSGVARVVVSTVSVTVIVKVSRVRVRVTSRVEVSRVEVSRVRMEVRVEVSRVRVQVRVEALPGLPGEPSG